MIMPDDLSRSYAAILPKLRALGYRPDMRASWGGERFLIALSTLGTVRVYSDGSWADETGCTGPDPDSLLAMLTDRRFEEAARHRRAGDARQIARDILQLLRGLPVGAVVSLAERDGGWDVQWRPERGPLAAARIDDPQADAAAVAVAGLTA